jgi:hypothetical protein
VRESLAELANEEVQRRLWTSPESPTDFIECICELFDDSALGEALDGGEGVFGHDADSILREIDTLAQRIDGMRTPDAVVNDPLMLQLRDLAARALAALDAAEQGDR